MVRNVLLLSLFFLFSSFSDEKPRVLIIGDSISIGYTPFVQEMMKEEAIVIHNPGNAQHTGTGLKKIEEWLGNEEWDLIHFNWGLWDLAYRHPDASAYGKRDKINGTVTFTPEQYARNLDSLVTTLKKTGASLLFATTSYVPEGEVGRVQGDDKRYNTAAKRVMKKHGVQINNLYRLSKKIHPRYRTKPGDVHYKPEGYEQLGQQVASKIRKALKKRKR